MLFVPIVAKIGKKARNWFSVGSGFVTMIFVLMLIPNIKEETTIAYNWIPGMNISIGMSLDGLSVFVAVIAGVIGALVLLYSVKYMEEAELKGYSLSRYYVLTLLFIGAMIGLALTDNFLVLYIFWEVVGFCSYALIAYYYRDIKAVRGGTKAFITTRVGDIGFLVAILALWYGSSIATGNGTFNIHTIINLAGGGAIPSNMLAIAGIGVILGAIGKSAQVPLHVWLPDAMEAPTTTTALIHAATMVNAGVYLIARCYPIFETLNWWLPTVAWIGAITAFLAATIAMLEKDIKRVLAYSTISQLGYMMSAVGVGAVLASQFHLVSHAIFKALLFLCAGAVIHTLGTRDMYEMGGLRKEMKWTHVSFLIGIFALMGVPIFNGFWSKDMILDGAFKGGYFGILILLVVTAFITVIYSWRMYWLVFMGKKSGEKRAHDAPWEMTVPLIILAFCSIVSWVPIQRYTTKMLSVPFSNMKEITFFELVSDTLLSPAILSTVIIVIFILFLALRYKEKIADAFKKENTIVAILKAGYGFDAFYIGIVNGIRGFSKKLRKIQTGDVNYNIISMVTGAIIFFVFLLLTRWV